jgi:hypothetical protein
MPQIELRATDRRKAESNWLAQHRADVTSQRGQDGVIAKIFEIIGTTNKSCCEIGAHDGKSLSNTFNLITNHGWTGYLIEGDVDRFAKISKHHVENQKRVVTLNAYAGFEAPNRLDDLLTAMGAPADLDFLSIDVDGNDYHLWESLDGHHPRVVQIEYNGTVPNDVIFIQDRDFALNQGCSALALIELGKRKGYEVVSLMSDAFFVRAELFSRFGIKDNSIDALHFDRHELRIWQGFDGTFFNAGHRVAGSRVRREFGPEDLQVLAPEERTFVKRGKR